MIQLVRIIMEPIVVFQRHRSWEIVNEFFVGVKGVGDVLAGFWSRVLTSSSLTSRASLTCLLGYGAGCWC